MKIRESGGKFPGRLQVCKDTESLKLLWFFQNKMNEENMVWIRILVNQSIIYYV